VHFGVHKVIQFSFQMRSGLQDPFQKEFLQVKLSLLKKSSISASSCQQASSHHASSQPATRQFELAPASSQSAIRLAHGLASSHTASSRPAIWLASDLASSHPASSCPATLPARRSRGRELATRELVALSIQWTIFS
ncbi:UNVERIFIED_CONTAM: hypothetical protein Slati_2251000, partial [Sesamum latifolium]